MKRTFFLLLAISLVAALALPASVQAQIASTQTWTSSIYYYNPEDGSGSITIDYIGSDGNPVNDTALNVPVSGHGSGEIYIGDVNLSAEFKGAAVLSASVPVVAVYEQSPSGSDTNYGRLLYSAFDISQGNQFVYIPTFVNQTGGYKTQVGVQNLLNENATLTLTFYDQNGTKVTDYTPDPIVGNASYIFTGDDIPGGLLTSFDGSLVIDAGVGGSVVAAAEELQNNGRRAYAFEGVSTVSTAVYMPSMMCRYSRGQQTSSYAIQNAGTIETTLNVKLYNEATRKPVGEFNLPNKVQPGAKYTLNLCNLSGASGKSGSAVITSNAGQNLAIVGKVSGTDGLMTAYTGRTTGSTRVVLPYTVWSANPAKGYRSFISVMNVGSAAATDITATYYKPDGTVAKSVALSTTAKPLPVNYKVSTNPQAAGALRSDASYRGAVEINSTQSVVVIIRVEKKLTGVKGYTYFGEDYTGIPYAPQ